MKYFSSVVIILLACSQPVDNARSDIRAVVTGILDADNHADIERVLSYYCEDAVLMPPGKEEIRGKDNIRKNYENIFATSSVDLFPEEGEVIVSDVIATYKGRTKGKVVVKSDSSERMVNDKFIMILRKENDQWKIGVLIWN